MDRGITSTVIHEARPDPMLTTVDAVEQVLEAHASDLGPDFTGYRHHVYRVLNLCAIQGAWDEDATRKFALAAVFHDLGIWTDHTFDYLDPSVGLAEAHLAGTGLAAWAPEIATMILEHHKILPHRAAAPSLVEPFRRADWIDVTRGVRTFGLPRSRVGPILAHWPSAGFHKRLVQLTFERLRRHPLSPLPMIRW